MTPADWTGQEGGAGGAEGRFGSGVPPEQREDVLRFIDRSSSRPVREEAAQRPPEGEQSLESLRNLLDALDQEHRAEAASHTEDEAARADAPGQRFEQLHDSNARLLEAESLLQALENQPRETSSEEPEKKRKWLRRALVLLVLLLLVPAIGAAVVYTFPGVRDWRPDSGRLARSDDGAADSTPEEIDDEGAAAPGATGAAVAREETSPALDTEGEGAGEFGAQGGFEYYGAAEGGGVDLRVTEADGGVEVEPDADGESAIDAAPGADGQPAVGDAPAGDGETGPDGVPGADGVEDPGADGEAAADGAPGPGGEGAADASDPMPEEAPPEYKQALRELREGDSLPNAADALENFAEENPEHPLAPEALLRAAQALLMAGAHTQEDRLPEELLQRTQELVERASDRADLPQAQRQRADALRQNVQMELAQFGETADLLAQLVDPQNRAYENLPVLRSRALIYSKMGRYQQAEDAWLRAADIDENYTSEWDYYQLGNMYEQRANLADSAVQEAQFYARAVSYWKQAMDATAPDEARKEWIRELIQNKLALVQALDLEEPAPPGQEEETPDLRTAPGGNE